MALCDAFRERAMTPAHVRYTQFETVARWVRESFERRYPGFDVCECNN